MRYIIMFDDLIKIKFVGKIYDKNCKPSLVIYRQVTEIKGTLLTYQYELHTYKLFIY